jgi:hypothetical protein
VIVEPDLRAEFIRTLKTQRAAEDTVEGVLQKRRGVHNFALHQDVVFRGMKGLAPDAFRWGGRPRHDLDPSRRDWLNGRRFFLPYRSEALLECSNQRAGCVSEHRNAYPRKLFPGLGVHAHLNSKSVRIIGH